MAKKAKKAMISIEGCVCYPATAGPSPMGAANAALIGKVVLESQARSPKEGVPNGESRLRKEA